MKLLKVIVFFVIIYFIRSFIQMYRRMKNFQIEQERAQQQARNRQRPQETTTYSSEVIEADFKVMDEN